MERTMFYFFFKWQYLLRHEFMQQEKIKNFGEYLTTRTEDPKCLQSIQDIFRQYLDKNVKPSHLFMLVPKKIRRGHHLVEFTFEDSTLKAEIDFSEIEIKDLKKSILKELEDALDLCAECQDDNSAPPEKFIAIGSENYWKKPASNNIKQFSLDFCARFIGIILWDWQTQNKNVPIGELIKMLDEEYPGFEERCATKDSDHHESVYIKRLEQASRCIEKGEFSK